MPTRHITEAYPRISTPDAAELRIYLPDHQPRTIAAALRAAQKVTGLKHVYMVSATEKIWDHEHYDLSAVTTPELIAALDNIYTGSPEQCRMQRAEAREHPDPRKYREDSHWISHRHGTKDYVQIAIDLATELEAQ